MREDLEKREDIQKGIQTLAHRKKEVTQPKNIARKEDFKKRLKKKKNTGGIEMNSGSRKRHGEEGKEKGGTRGNGVWVTMTWLSAKGKQWECFGEWEKEKKNQQTSDGALFGGKPSRTEDKKKAGGNKVDRVSLDGAKKKSK